MAAVALQMRDSPPSGATRTVDDPGQGKLIGDVINGTTRDGKSWQVRIFPRGVKEAAEVQELTAIVNPGAGSEKAIFARAGMLALPFDAQIILQYSHPVPIEGVTRPIVSVNAAHMLDGTAVDHQGARHYDTKSILGTDEQISLEVCSITYKDSPFLQAVTLGREAINLLQQGEAPILKAPQGAFYGPPDQNALCAGA